MSSTLTAQAVNLLNMKTMPERLAYALALAGISQAELARRVGVTRGAISLLLKSADGQMTAANNDKAAEALGVDARWLATGRGRRPDSPSGAPVSLDEIGPAEPPPFFRKSSSTQQASRVPVVGCAQLGENGWYEEVQTPGSDGYVETHSSDPDAYALRVRGDSMYPAIRDGWYVVVEPNGQPAAGEYVAISLRDGRKMVKEHLFAGSGSITVQSVNGGARMTVSNEDVHAVHSIGAVLMPSKHRDL